MLRLNEGWRLSDGILAPVFLREPRDVVSALTEAAILREPDKGLNSLCCEWVSARRWTYELHFVRPEPTGDQLLGLYFERLAGKGCVRVNGVKKAEFCDQSLWVDMTQEIREGENQLEIVVEPRLHPLPGWDTLPEIGLCGGAFLHESIELRLESLHVQFSGNILTVESRLSHPLREDCEFCYRVLREDEVLLNRSCAAKAEGERRDVRHELKLRDLPLWQSRSPQENLLTVEMEVRRGQMLCDSVRFEVAAEKEKPLRVVQVDADQPDALLTAQMEALGAQACVPLRAARGRFSGTLCGGFPQTEYSLCALGSAMQREELLPVLIGGEEIWPPEEASLWRLRAKVQDLPDVDLCAMPFEEVCRYQRAMQAEHLRELAETKRLAGEMLQVRLNEHSWKLSSSAITDADGRERAAFYALKQAWAPVHVAVLPGDEQKERQIYLLCDGTQCDVMDVRVLLYDLKGGLLREKTFMSLSERNMLLGDFEIAFPDGRQALLLRTELRDSRGEVCEVCDRLIFAVSDEEKRLKALTGDTAEPEQLGGNIKNTDRTACVCLLAGGQYGTLLPGETREDARLEQAEWINPS